MPAELETLSTAAEMIGAAYGTGTTADRRHNEKLGRDWLSAAELWRQATGAAAAELGRENFSDYDRESVAAEIVERVLVKVGGGDPAPMRRIDSSRRVNRVWRSRTSAYQRALAAEREEVSRAADQWRNGIAPAGSREVSFTAFCGIAANRRAVIVNERKRRADAAAIDAMRAPMVAQVGVIGTDLDGLPARVRRLAAVLALDLDYPPHAALAYSYGADLPTAEQRAVGTVTPAEVAAMVGQRPATFRSNVERARKRACIDAGGVHADEHDPADLAAAIAVARRLVGQDVAEAIDPDGPCLVWAEDPAAPWPVGIRRDGDYHRSHLPAPDRTGTGPDGAHVEPIADTGNRAANRRIARARCDSFTAGDYRRQRKVSAEDKARAIRKARRALARAYRAESIARNGTKGESLPAVPLASF